MSRRITFFVLAASAALIASPASADRECFENSCLPAAVEASPQADPAPEPEARAEDAQPVLARPDLALTPAPVKTLPPAVQAQAVQAQAVQAQAVQAKEPHQLQPLAPGAIIEARRERVVGEAAPVEAIRVAPGYARTERPAGYGVSPTVAGGAAVIEVLGAVYARTYAGYRRAPVYAVAPDAKIITIDAND